MDNWIDLVEAAQRLGIEHSTAWRWVQKGKLKPTMVIKHRIYFDRNYIDLMAEQLTKARKQPTTAA